MKVKFLRGDSLIEVLLATAIFSIAAVSVIGAMRHGLNNAQISLESTMALSEIDIQAEALRFIQESYSADHSNPFYSALWEKIASLSNSPNDEISKNIDYGSYTEPYDEKSPNKIYQLRPFIINTRFLSSAESEYLSKTDDASRAAIIDSVIISYSESDNHFSPASVYPRLIYTDSSGHEQDNTLADSPILSSSYTNLSEAEGIWIVAVRDAELAEDTNFIDFYINTCWSAPGSSMPSRVSTIARLAAPEEFETINYISKSNIALVFHYPTGDNKYGSSTYVAEGTVVGDNVVVDIKMAPDESSIYIDRASGNLFSGWGLGEINESPEPNVDNTKDWSIPGKYCSTSQYAQHIQNPGLYPSCEHTSVEIPIKTDSKTTTYFHFYASIKHPIYLGIIVDVSGTMADKINWFGGTIENLRNEIYETGGRVILYSIGGWYDADTKKYHPKSNYDKNNTNCIGSYKCMQVRCDFNTCADDAAFESAKKIASNIAKSDGVYSDNPEWHGQQAMLQLANKLQDQITEDNKTNPNIPLDSPRLIVYLTDTYGSRNGNWDADPTKLDLYTGYQNVIDHASGTKPYMYVILKDYYDYEYDREFQFSYQWGKLMERMNKDFGPTVGDALKIGGKKKIDFTFKANGELLYYAEKK